MGTTLIINPGSSSKKFALYKDGALVITWHFEQTGQGFTVCTEENRTKSLCRDIKANEFKEALDILLTEAVEKKIISQVSDINTVGIRVVAPGTYFTEHRVVDDTYVSKLKALSAYAPHHIPLMLIEIERVRKSLPAVQFIGISDSAFHKTIEGTERKYSLLREDAERYDIQKYGYHGISVSSIVKHLHVKEGSVPEKMVVIHVGSGVSVSAISSGKSIANSMGYSPVSGIMMSSRAGDLSADVLAALVVRKGLNSKNIFEYLYEQGGFKGLAGVKDLRLVLDRAEKNEKGAQEALAMFARQVKDYIARYAMLMDGLDLIVLTATAAERNPVVRSLLVGHLPLFHTYIHDERNEALLSSEGYIHTDDSGTKILVLHTDELGEMYRITTSFK